MAKHDSCRRQLNRAHHHLIQAIKGADKRGYTGMLHSKGALFDDPRVKVLKRKFDELLKKC